MNHAGKSPSTRRLVGGDLTATSRLHRRVLTLGLFPRLGPGFLHAYHRTFVDSPHAIALGVSRAGRLDGFLVGTIDHEAHGDWVRSRHRIALATRGLLALLVRPWLWGWFLRTRARTYTRTLTSRFTRWSSARSTRSQTGDGPSWIGPRPVEPSSCTWPSTTPNVARELDERSARSSSTVPGLRGVTTSGCPRWPTDRPPTSTIAWDGNGWARQDTRTASNWCATGIPLPPRETVEHADVPASPRPAPRGPGRLHQRDRGRPSVHARADARHHPRCDA